VPDWLDASDVLIVAGKGGVGSTTVVAATALLAARQGGDVLVVSVDGKPRLGRLLGGGALRERETELTRLPGGGRIRGRTIPPQQAFRDYLDLRGIGGLLRRAAQAASLDVIAASTPGLEHLLVLGKIKELARTEAADLIVVDAPPSGHAAPFLRSAFATQQVVSRGPLRDQADQVAALLADPARTRAMVVTIPEETPVNEAVELSTDLSDHLGMALTPLVVNCCWPDRPGLAMATTTAARDDGVKITARQRSALVASSRFGAARLDVQRTQMERLDELCGTERIELPRLATPRLERRDIEILADVLAGGDRRENVR
jgi:anion-transporting  ArsA/GET3 family ATPase